LLYWFSMEEQVISRAHRMGATRPIHVETLAMRGTIEEQMVEFLQVNLSLTVNSIRASGMIRIPLIIQFHEKYILLYHTLY
jgi:hypothetical protein